MSLLNTTPSASKPSKLNLPWSCEYVTATSLIISKPPCKVAVAVNTLPATDKVIVTVASSASISLAKVIKPVLSTVAKSKLLDSTASNSRALPK